METNKFILDENISLIICSVFEKFNYDCTTVGGRGLQGTTDQNIIKYVKDNKLILVTGDLDFAMLYYGYELGKIGIIVLRSKLQSIGVSSKIIRKLHVSGVMHNDLSGKLVIATLKKVRIRGV